MFGLYDDAARRVVIIAQDEARKLNHHSIDTEHLLLALLREGRGVAARALTGLGIGYDAVLARVEETVGRGAEPTPGHMPFTESAKRAMQYCLEESLGLRHNHIGTEHILLALVRDENAAARILAGMGAAAQRVRERVLSSRD
jgi:ATP-dependent Clp protease ATP-binding subunit ClpC